MKPPPKPAASRTRSRKELLKIVTNPKTDMMTLHHIVGQEQERNYQIKRRKRAKLLKHTHETNSYAECEACYHATPAPQPAPKILRAAKQIVTLSFGREPAHMEIRQLARKILEALK